MAEGPDEIEETSREGEAIEAHTTDDVAPEELMISIAPDEPEEEAARPPPLPRAALRIPPLPAEARRRGAITLPAIDLESAALVEDRSSTEATTAEPTRPQATGEAPSEPLFVRTHARGTRDERLRQELAQSSDGEREAAIRSVLACADEVRGHGDAALEGYRAALEADPTAREAIEGLLGVATTAGRHDAREQAIDLLVGTAEGPEERARAWTLRAVSLDAGTPPDDVAVQDAAERAIREDDASKAERSLAWLMKERAAIRRDDVASRIEALEGRIAHTNQPTWKALLMLDRAEIAAEQGELQEALDLLDRARSTEPRASWMALDRAERWLRSASLDDAGLAGRLAKVKDEQATRLAAAIADPAVGDASGIPRRVRTPTETTLAWLEQARLERHVGDDDAEAAALERARRFLTEIGGPVEPSNLAHLILLVTTLRRAAATKTGDSALAAKLAEDAWRGAEEGSARAALSVRMAEHARDRGDEGAWIEALWRASEEDPVSAQVWAHLLGALGTTDAPRPLAEAFEALAARVDDPRSRARAFLAAAYLWATRGDDPARARQALEGAKVGVSAEVAARIGRALSAAKLDPASRAWFADATHDLLAALETTDPKSDAEVLALRIEKVRHHLREKDAQGLARAIEGVRREVGGGWIGLALQAFGGSPKNPAATNEGDAADTELASALFAGETDGPAVDEAALGAEREREDTALEALIARTNDADERRHLRLTAVLKSDPVADRAKIRAGLESLFAEDPRDPLVGGYLLALAHAESDEAGAAKLAGALAEALADDAEFAGARLLEAGFSSWKAGDRPGARAAFEKAEALVPEAAEAAVAWASRGSARTTEARRDALLLEEHLRGEDAALALERFALEAVAGDREEAAMALTKAEATDDPGLRLASAMARMAWGTESGGRTAWREAADRIAATGAEGLRTASAEAFRSVRRDVDGTDPAALTRASKAWVDAGGGAVATLEWLGATIREGNVKSEISARLAMSEYFAGDGREELVASAALLARADRPAERVALLHGTSAATRLANLELAPAGSEADARARALIEVGDTLGSEARLDALGLAGWSRVAAGDPIGARDLFLEVTQARSGDLAAWEGVRTTAAMLDDHELVAIACEELGKRSTNPARGAAFLEHAGLLWLALAATTNEDATWATRGEAALDAALTRDPRRFEAFDKLFRRVRDRNDGPEVTRLARNRLAVADDPAEIAKLHWEMARAFRAKGDIDAALQALQHVTRFDEHHVGALALTGEIFIRRGRFADAAACLATLAQLGSAPAKNRVTAGVAAVDLFENKLDQPAEALAVLLALHRENLTTLPLRERMARAAAKAGAWEEATTILEQLMVERAETQGRIEAARLAMVVYRDKLKRPEAAVPALSKLLDEAPTDGDALDFLLALDPATEGRALLLAGGKEALVAALRETPDAPDQLTRLGRIARALGSPSLERVAWTCLTAVAPNGGGEEGLAGLPDAGSRLPDGAVSRELIAELSGRADESLLTELFIELGPTLGEAFGPSLGTIGVHPKKDRVDPRSGLLLHREIHTWMSTFGIEAFDLFVGGPESDGIYGIPGEIPAIVVGPGVRAPLSPLALARTVRALVKLLRGATDRRSPGASAQAIVLAVCRLTKTPVSGSGDPPADIERALAKALGRRTKARVTPLCQGLAKGHFDASSWDRSARLVAECAAAVACGDVGVVLRDPEAFGDVPSSMKAELVTDLLRFVLSPRYVDLRRALGLEG